ncbi:hypothetical protein K438DRAFT_588947 [Mycena galopus ATCC 62051]|nr:hypothetical protein K438DRAFT_588947 [Mycena galopus ATCC 62051]
MYCFYPNSGSPQTFSESGLAPFAKLNMESTIISSLTLDQYHCPCYWKLAQDRSTSVSTSEPVNLGAVYSGSSDSNWADIACMPYLKLERDTYFSYMDDRRPKEVMENGWTQLASGDAAGAHSDFKWVHHLQHFHEFSGHWFSQANHVFKCLGISSNFENYILTHRIEFHLSISRTTAEPPEGFLFFCPPDDFQIDGPSSFKWPDCPAYWSFDPSGVERLSREDAVSLGFPSMNFSTQLYGLSWDEKVYPGLWQCHQAKGFDPDTQDLARHLGYPLYQVSSETRPTFAHIDGEQPCEGHGQSDNIPEPVDTHHAASLDTASQHSSLAEELSVSNTFRFVRNFVADLIPGAHAESEEGIGFSPILM